VFGYNQLNALEQEEQPIVAYTILLPNSHTSIFWILEIVCKKKYYWLWMADHGRKQKI